MRKYKGLLAIFAVVLVLTLGLKEATAAGSSVSLTTSPVALSLNIKPGTTSSNTLQLMNNGNVPVKISMHLDIFSAKGDNGAANITSPAPNDPSSNWVNFSPSSFIAQPGVWSSVKMTISLPKTAQLGYYYAVVFEPDVSTQSTIKANTIKGSNGILVLVDTSSANEKRSVSLASFSVSHKVYEYLPANFTVNVHNTGNIFLAPYGNIYIGRSSTLSSSIASLSVNSTGGNVLPNSSRNFQASWSDGFPAYQPKTLDGQVIRDKNGNVVQQLKWDFTKVNKFRFGKYYAQLALTYNNGQVTIPLTSVVSFWVLPWKLLIVLLVVLGLIGLGVWSFVRNLVRRINKVRR